MRGAGGRARALPAQGSRASGGEDVGRLACPHQWVEQGLGCSPGQDGMGGVVIDAWTPPSRGLPKTTATAPAPGFRRAEGTGPLQSRSSVARAWSGREAERLSRGLAGWLSRVVGRGAPPGAPTAEGFWACLDPGLVPLWGYWELCARGVHLDPGHKATRQCRQKCAKQEWGGWMCLCVRAWVGWGAFSGPWERGESGHGFSSPGGCGDLLPTPSLRQRPTRARRPPRCPEWSGARRSAHRSPYTHFLSTLASS